VAVRGGLVPVHREYAAQLVVRVCHGTHPKLADDLTLAENDVKVLTTMLRRHPQVEHSACLT
jgi:hypothetical protein